jgi:hypothetical protein
MTQQLITNYNVNLRLLIDKHSLQRIREFKESAKLVIKAFIDTNDLNDLVDVKYINMSKIVIISINNPILMGITIIDNEWMTEILTDSLSVSFKEYFNINDTQRIIRSTSVSLMIYIPQK